MVAIKFSMNMSSVSQPPILELYKGKLMYTAETVMMEQI